MSDKPTPKPTAPKPAAKTVGTSSGAKGWGSAGKTKPEENFEFLDPPKNPDEIGRLAHYRVLRILGKGGMGTVFMAEDTRLHRIVALKVMLPSIAKKEVARDRFIREARATAKIDHDHIITIYEVNENSAVPYAAMQYLKGVTLEDWLKAGKTLNVPQIMRIGKEIAKGLAAAHAQGLIHRDIKPSNIWLDAVNKGRVKILDFGLARPTNEETHLTQEGLILGTPAYMSPEQARAHDVDARCDLFSLGCVLYRLCAGKLPFAGKDAMSMLLAIQTDAPPDLQPLNADVPAAFAELVHKMLSKKPADRPESAKAVVTAIQNIERDWIAGGRTASTPNSRLPSRDLSARAGDETLAAEGVELVDPALEESAITELELVETEVASGPDGTRRSRAWIFAALGGALFAVLSIFCCLGVTLATDHGVIDIVIDAGDETARRLIDGTKLKVWDHHNQGHPVKLGENKLPSGGYHFEQTDLPEGLHFEPNPFSLPRGETRTIKISYLPPRPSKPVRPALVEVHSGEVKSLQKEWASFLKRDVVTVNSVDIKLVLIPPGEFTMGSSKDLRTQNDFFKKLKKEGLPEIQAARLAAETPAHRVQITRPFYMGATEVTVEQFKKFVAAKSYTTEPAASRKGGTGLDAGKDIGRKPEFDWLNLGPGYKAARDHPVSNITWKDAQAFCAWLSEKEKKTYRLPTEAEWEYACRAGSNELWSFGDDLREAQARAYMWFHAPLKFTANPTTPKPVAQKKANDFGLFDMHGNVAEMCADLWGPAYYERCVKESLVADPKGPEPGRETNRIVRGGSFIETAQAARSAYRQFLDPTLGHVHVGFRVVCEIPLPE